MCRTGWLPSPYRRTSRTAGGAKAQNNIKRSGPFLCRDLAHFYSAIDSQDAETAGCAERVGQKVQRPALARPQRLRSTSPFPAPPTPDAQLLLGIQPIQLFVVRDHSFAFQHHADPPVAEPTPLFGDSFHLCSDLRIIPLSCIFNALPGSGRAFTPDRLRIAESEAI